MTISGYGRAAAADEEIQIGSLVSLLHVLDIKLVVTALRRLGRLPGGATLRALSLAHIEMQSARRHIELDDVAGLHERERSASRRLGRHVQNHGAIRRAAHACIRDT